MKSKTKNLKGWQLNEACEAVSTRVLCFVLGGNNEPVTKAAVKMLHSMSEGRSMAHFPRQQAMQGSEVRSRQAWALLHRGATSGKPRYFSLPQFPLQNWGKR